MTTDAIEQHALRAARHALTEGVPLWDAVLATGYSGTTLADHGAAYDIATDRVKVVLDD